MKLTSTILSEFIADFKLKKSEVGICFDAIVNFNLGIQNFNIKSEVYMESGLSHNLDSIYLLNTVIARYKMPTFLNDVNHHFNYISYKALIVTGNMPLFGDYTISIFPKSRFCTPKTFAELRAKKLN
ncbi:MAG: hypothetical protein ABIS01_15665 [Ferruginibacter sp.]